MRERQAIAAIAARDLRKFLRDRSRLALSVLVPFLLMFLLGSTLQRNLGSAAAINFISFTFTGVLGMTLFQSSMQGLASLLDDRQSDLAQEIFVAPVSRHAIVFGKILGETMVALAQTIPLVVFALVLGVPIPPEQLLLMVPVALASCLLGGSFGLVAMSLINSRRAADQIFNFLLLPQLFLAGVFNPIATLPWYLEVLSRLVLYAGRPEYHKVVLLDPLLNLTTIALMFAACMIAGTALFVQRETNR